jgi:hypothetical protein
VASQLLNRTKLLLRAMNWIMAEVTRTVRRCEVAQAAEHDGLTSIGHLAAGHVRLSAGEVRRLIRNGRALEQPPAVAAVAVWVLTAYFGLGVVMNAASRSRPERLVMTPVALVLCGACLLVAAR